jgi:hypothetical protein
MGLVAAGRGVDAFGLALAALGVTARAARAGVGRAFAAFRAGFRATLRAAFWGAAFLTDFLAAAFGTFLDAAFAAVVAAFFVACLVAFLVAFFAAFFAGFFVLLFAALFVPVALFAVFLDAFDLAIGEPHRVSTAAQDPSLDRLS